MMQLSFDRARWLENMPSPQEDGVLNYYRISGWTVSVNRPLPYLVPAESAVEDIAIRFRPFTPTAGDPIAIISGFRIFGPALVEFSTADDFHARISDGRLIEIDLPPGMTAAEVQTLVFGRCFGLLCQQRGQPPLHACAVWLGRGAIAVAGNSGVGKSTTARALMQRGYDLLTDDQLIFDPDTGLAQACIPSNKLRQDTADRLGEPIDPTQRVLRDAAKFHAPVSASFRAEPAPLRVIFLLAPKPGLERPQFRRLSPPEVIANLTPIIVRNDLAAAIGAQAIQFRWLSKIAATIPVYGVWRGDDLARLDPFIDELLTISASHGATDSPEVLRGYGHEFLDKGIGKN